MYLNNLVADNYNVRGESLKQLNGLIKRKIAGAAPKNRGRILQILARDYEKSFAAPGEPVGIISGTSLGENQTQMNLNAFHHSGITNLSVIAGIPKFTELIEVTKSPKFVNSTLFTTCSSEEELRTFNFIYVIFKNFIKMVDKKEDEILDWFYIYNILYEKPIFTNYYKIYLKLSEMFEHNIYIEHISSILETNGLEVMHSPYDDIICVSANSLPSQNELECICFLENIYISGIYGIKDVAFKLVDNEWIIETNGSNLIECSKLPFVIYEKSHSNNLWEIFEIFGIEGVYYFLVNEFDKILSGSTNICHILTMVSLMTHCGFPTPISRYGMNSKNYGPCAMASFEESFDKIVQASTFGVREEIKSISSSIICAKAPCIGTGIMDLFQIQ
jgi:DNA-directed RNA polymerase beta' subunit